MSLVRYSKLPETDTMNLITHKPLSSKQQDVPSLNPGAGINITSF